MTTQATHLRRLGTMEARRWLASPLLAPLEVVAQVTAWPRLHRVEWVMSRLTAITAELRRSA